MANPADRPAETPYRDDRSEIDRLRIENDLLELKLQEEKRKHKEEFLNFQMSEQYRADERVKSQVEK